MAKPQNSTGIHIMVVPFPVQGHINPMLQFSKRLASKGLRVTFVTTFSQAKSIQGQSGLVSVQPISDGVDDDGEVQGMVDRFKIIASRRLPELILEHGISENPVKCLLYDSAMPGALEIAKGLGLVGASFFTQSCAVGVIYYNLHQGVLSVPVTESRVLLDGLPVLGNFDLPSFLYDPKSYPSFLNLVKARFSNVNAADWMFFNTFNSLENEVVKWMESQWPIKTIGPTIPSMYIDKRLEGDTDYGLSLFKPNVEACMKWLDSKETGSVVYVSFGSMATLGEEHMEEIAWGLKISNTNFLWVVRESEEEKLPTNFMDETLEKGLVVTWCSQLEVLAHHSIGCFITHCGWNSTLEALSLGVPMVAMPQWTDQPTNAKFVVDVWRVGVRVKVDEKGIARKDEIEKSIREVMEGEKGNEIKMNSTRYKELAKEAVDEGGSSDKNIDEFVANLLCI